MKKKLRSEIAHRSQMLFMPEILQKLDELVELETRESGSKATRTSVVTALVVAKHRRAFGKR